ncbi:MAG: DUF2889 domain-containing protein [Burkholderiales bacterium]
MTRPEIPPLPESRSVDVPAPAGRRSVHLRRIICEGFLRDDGLYDIEGTLIDTKPDDAQLPHRIAPANQPIHRMMVRLTIDTGMVIRDAQAFSLDAPYPDCYAAPAPYREVIGLRIGPGFTQTIKRLFRGERGCAHLTELLPPMATTAYQTLWEKKGDETSPIGTCHGLRVDGEVVRLYFSSAPRARPLAGGEAKAGLPADPD